MKRSKDIEVQLTFLPTEHGGRKGPAFNNYRSQFYYAGHDWDAAHDYPDVEQVNPGDTARSFLCFLSPDEHIGKVTPGMAFLVREGQKVVAYGVVLRLLDLEASAAAAKLQRLETER